MIIVIDDNRQFTDEHFKDALFYRTSMQGLLGLAVAHIDHVFRYGTVLEELWLDHDLGGLDTTMPVVDWLVLNSYNTQFLPIKSIYIHSMNAQAARDIVVRLSKCEYNVRTVDLSDCTYVEKEEG